MVKKSRNVNKYRSVAWHEEVLKNMFKSLKGLQLKRKSLDYEIEEALKRYIKLFAQIDKAKAMGKPGFDAERFGVKRIKK